MKNVKKLLRNFEHSKSQKAKKLSVQIHVPQNIRKIYFLNKILGKSIVPDIFAW